MKRLLMLSVAVTVLWFAGVVSAQSPVSASVPRLVTITGTFEPADGRPARAVETITLTIYAEPAGGTPLWQETQTIPLDSRGRYSLLLGATGADGIPADVFAAGAQWLATRFDRPGEQEGPRVRLTMVPYAARSADADTLGGHPVSAFLLAPTGNGSTSTHAAGSATSSGTTASSNGSATSPAATPNALLGGTPNQLAKYVNATDVGDSAVTESAGRVGIGTTGPLDSLHVRFTNLGGGLTGYAVQNLGNTASSYSGMLFYDHLGNLGQFQGFNNITHEYRINNIAKTGLVTDGSINFMVGSTSKFFVSPTNIGIGTTTPAGVLDVSNALIPTFAVADVNVTTYGTNNFGAVVAGRKARGTAAAPTAVLNGDPLVFFGGKGYGTTGFSTFTSGFSVNANENWTDTAQGTFLNFSTTPIGTTQPVNRMTVANNGNVGIGTPFGAGAILEVSNATNTGAFGNILTSSFTGANSGGSLLVGRKARGTSAAPTAALNGDILVGFLGSGYGTTTFSGTRGGMFVQAAENFTDTAQGTRLFFNTTATGTTGPSTKMAITPSGDIGIGTMNPAGAVEIVRNSESDFIGTSYTTGDAGAVFFQRARGTSLAPSGVLAGDSLGFFGGTGYGATHFGDSAGVVAIVAMENWTDTANGNAIGFATTPLGTTGFVVQAAILPNGNLGLGTPGDANQIPTAADKLQVYGDIRVGAGANGCVKDFAGTALTGTCASDRRYKKNITPFGAVLSQVTALQPVHYYWRAAEFPEKHFGDAQSYGLIAQDVEQILPELVVTNADGYKAVDYSKLPLLTIQALKELKAENDALKTSSMRSVEEMKSENDALKERVAELERLLTRLLATTSPR